MHAHSNEQRRYSHIFVYGMSVFLFFLFAVFSLSFFESAHSATPPPSLVTYQGKLINNGEAVSTTQSIGFMLYDSLTSGVLRYTASGTLGSTTTVSITPTSGIFSVNFGGTNTNAITPELYATTTNLFLEVVVGGTALSPRKQLTSAPFAINSQFLMGVTATSTSSSEYIPISDLYGNFDYVGMSTSSNIYDAVVYVNPTSTVTNGALFTTAVGGASRFRVDGEGDVYVLGGIFASSTLYVETSVSSTVVTTSQYLSVGDFSSAEATERNAGFARGDANIGNNLWVKGRVHVSSTLFVTATSTFTTGTFSGRLGAGTSSPGYVFTASGTSYLQGTTTIAAGILDVKGRNPHPVPLNTQTDPSDAIGVDAQGDYLYVAGGANGLYVMNIADKSQPIIVSSTDPGSGGPVNDVFVSGDYAYTARGTDGIVIFNVADPNEPIMIGSNLIGASSQNVKVHGGYAYVGDDGSGLTIVDVHDPFNPVQVSALDLAGAEDDVFVAGGYAYVGTLGGVNDFHIVDVRDPTDPRAMSGMNIGNIFGLSISGSIAYAAMGTDGIAIIDISDPENPHLLRTVDPGGTLNDVYASGPFLYASNASPAMHVYDVTSSTNPTLVSTHNFSTSNNGLDIMEKGGYVYMAGESGGIEIMDVSGIVAGSADIGSATIENLEVRTRADFLQGVYARNGVHISNNGLFLSGDFSMHANTSTHSATNTLRFSHTARFVASSSLSYNSHFIFDTHRTVPSSTSNYIFSVRNKGVKLFSISSNGNAKIDGDVFASSTVIGTPGAPGDLAERVDIAIDNAVEPGDVMVVDPNTTDTYRMSESANAQAISGVISGNPTIVVGNGKTEHTATMALTGRVPIKVSAENGSIRRGDLLVSASIAGHAMKYDPLKDNGTQVVGIIGMALENHSEDEGKIMGLVQTGWVNNRHQTIAKIQDDLLTIANAQGIDINTTPRDLVVAEGEQGQIARVNGHLNLNGFSITNVASIFGVSDRWHIDAKGRFVTKVETSEGRTPLYAMQSQATEFVFSGSGTLENGVANILFDRVTRDIIDPSEPLKVSVTLTGPANGIYVSEKDGDGFVVEELQEGESSATFDWVVIAQRRTKDIRDEFVGSKYGGLPDGHHIETPLDEQIAQQADEGQQVEDEPEEEVEQDPSDDAGAEQNDGQGEQVVQEEPAPEPEPVLPEEQEQQPEPEAPVEEQAPAPGPEPVPEPALPEDPEPAAQPEPDPAPEPTE
jgi:hypothetical protein